MKIPEIKLGDLAIKLAEVGAALGLPNLDPTSGTIFLTSADGAVGHRVASRLLNAGYPNLRIGVTDREKFEDFNKLGAELADFDWMDETTYAKALVGVKSVFCATPNVRLWHAQFPLFLKACDAAGVKHYVKVSFYNAREKNDVFSQVPSVRAHCLCDELLVSGQYFNTTYTILQATHFMSNPLIQQGYNLRANEAPATFYGASAGKGVNYVSPDDVAEVAVRVLLCPKDHKNQEYILTGPSAITDQQVASLLSDHLKKPIMFEDQLLHTYEDGEKMGGDPKWMVDDLVAMEKVKATGVEETLVSNDIEKICGHPPDNFEDYLQHTEFMTAAEVN